VPDSVAVVRYSEEDTLDGPNVSIHLFGRLPDLVRHGACHETANTVRIFHHRDQSWYEWLVLQYGLVARDM